MNTLEWLGCLSVGYMLSCAIYLACTNAFRGYYATTFVNSLTKEQRLLRQASARKRWILFVITFILTFPLVAWLGSSCF